MRRALTSAALVALAACDDSPLPVRVVPVSPPGAKAIVTTLVREFDPSATKRDATWVAARTGAGPWTVLTSKGAGTYEVDIGAGTWAVAIACADVDDGLTAVTVHRRTDGTKSLAHVLDRQCSGIEDAHTLTGTLRNLPPASGWFDFGYVDEARGVAIPGDSDRAAYELVRVYDGTWDLAFGVRGSPGAPLTRIALLRGEVVASDHTLDVDLMGPSSFAPGSKGLVVRGVTTEESLEALVRYTAGGATGLDVGPPDLPSTTPDVVATYATFPPEIQREHDRYRGTIRAILDKEESAERAVRFALTRPIDVDVTLPPVLAPPEAVRVPGAPAAIVRTRLVASAGPDAEYAIRSRVRLRARQDHRWTTTYDAATAANAIDDTTADLSSVPGFRPRWGLPLGERIEVTVIVTERALPLGDGTIQRSSSAFAIVPP